MFKDLYVRAIEKRGRADEVAVQRAREELLEQAASEQLLQTLHEVALDVRLQQRVARLRRTRHTPAGAAAARRRRRKARRPASKVERSATSRRMSVGLLLLDFNHKDYIWYGKADAI